MRRQDRYPRTHRGPNGEPLCRGCGKPVPKGRQTWCSTECYNTRCPGMVDMFLFQRDKGVCSSCGVDTEYLRKVARRMFNRACGQPEWWDPRDDWSHSKAKHIRDALNKAGWPRLKRRWWEADHITPFSEGGETVLENMRTLCIRCHKHRTKTWHKQRTSDPNQPTLI